MIDHWNIIVGSLLVAASATGLIWALKQANQTGYVGERVEGRCGWWERVEPVDGDEEEPF